MAPTAPSPSGTATAKLVALAFAAGAPDELAPFWAQALGWNVRDAAGGDIELVPADGTSFSVLFRQAADGKVGQNRIHFDLTTTSFDDQESTVAELIAIGAKHIDIGQGIDESHVVLADPEGNEFCVIEPTNRFLSGCPRLGAVNCDGTRALGMFFSNALNWPLVWDQDEETAIQAPDGTGPKITWSGPPLIPQSGEERIHFHLAPTGTSEDTLDRLLAVGARRAERGRTCRNAIPLTDVDGNDLCLVEP